MSRPGELTRLVTILGRFFRRGPLALAICWLCLTIGLVETVVVTAIKSSLDQQLSHGELAGVDIIFRNGVSNEIASSLDSEEVEKLRALCSSRDCSFSPQLLISVPNPAARRGAGAGLTVRGVEAPDKIPGVSVTLIAGRYPRPGLDEVIAGEDALAAAGLAMGDAIKVKGRAFKIVGAFRAKGAPLGNEAIALSDQLRSAGFPGWSTVWIGGASTGARGLPADVVTETMRDAVAIVPARSHFLNQFRSTRRTVQRIVLGIVLLVAGFSIAAYVSSVRNVVRRSSHALGVLHMIGFSRGSVLAALAVNGAIIGLLAGLSAVALAKLAADGFVIALPAGLQTLNVAIEISFAVAGLAILFSILIGGAGALIAGRSAFAMEKRI